MIYSLGYVQPFPICIVSLIVRLAIIDRNIDLYDLYAQNTQK